MMKYPQEFGLTLATYDVPRLARELNVGRTSLYALVKSGRLRATKIGKRTIFRAVDVAAFLAELQQENA